MSELENGDVKNEHDEKLDGFDKEKTIFVNKKKIRVKEDHLTGKQILEKAGFSTDEYDLYLVQGQKSEQVKPDQKVHIKNDMRFNAIRKEVPYG